ncbi:MAG: hypothetical protein ACI8TX_000019 [Hyphomicrobiaceae bacterium]|jgi:hypothetical protein
MARLKPKQSMSYASAPEGDAAFAIAVLTLAMLSGVILLMVLLEILESAPILATIAVATSVSGFVFVMVRAFRDRAQAIPRSIAVTPPVLRLKASKKRKRRSALAKQAS